MTMDQQQQPLPSESKDLAPGVHIETWGCQMNTADSERMLRLLSERGYRLVPRAEDAELILLNTCHIREKARHKVVSRLGILKGLKAANPRMTIAVAGCVAQAEGRRLMKEAPQIDVLLGPGKIDELPNLLDEHRKTRTQQMAIGFKKAGGRAHHDEDHAAENHHGAGESSSEKTLEPLAPASDEAAAVAAATPTVTGRFEVSRYVNIQQGCNNYCTFCVVPFTRGRELSRTADDIEQECRNLLAAGAREITVLGQNVNSYGNDLLQEGEKAAFGTPFVALLDRLVELPGLERLRFTTSNPHDFTRELAQLFGAKPKLGRYIHLPVQHGNDAMLARMQRKVTVAQYHEKLAWLRAEVPDIAISTDLIVGFPGETEEQFEDLLALVAAAQFSFIFSFKYSPRRNTPAARYTDQVPEDVKDARLARLNALQDSITLAQNKAEIGQTRDVLFLYESQKDPGHFYGRTEHFRLVRVASQRSLVGELAAVRIVEANRTALLGELN